MNHLMAWYGRITVADIEKKKKNLQEPLDMSQPIGMLFKVINDGLQYYSEVNTLFKLAQVL